MPWHEVPVVEQRLEFVHLAQQQGVSLAELCRRFGISRVTGYKWLERAESGQGLTDRSRRPQSSPRRTPEQIAEQVLALRRQHPAWGSPAAEHGLSQLSIWLIRLGIRLSFSGIRHPQTNGKDERFHRSLKAEVLRNQAFQSLEQAQRAFDRWRPVYNQQRPHEGIGYAVPADRYQPSPRRFPGKLPPIEYGPDDQVAVVGWNGQVRFKGRRLKVSNALKDLPIALRPSTSRDGHYDLYFCHHRFAHIDLHKA